jgi:predicted DNA-binding protein YlxM (UPF0122 family)
MSRRNRFGADEKPRREDIEVQKGAIHDNRPPTSKMMYHYEKLNERERQLEDLRDGMTLHFHEPKR